MNDNDTNDLQRIKALESAIGILRRDLGDAERMLRLTPDNPRLKRQKGANEKLIFMAQVELGKVRKNVRRKGIGNVE
jgi:hypothetical protein